MANREVPSWSSSSRGEPQFDSYLKVWSDIRASALEGCLGCKILSKGILSFDESNIDKDLRIHIRPSKTPLTVTVKLPGARMIGKRSWASEDASPPSDADVMHPFSPVKKGFGGPELDFTLCYPAGNVGDACLENHC